MVRTGNRGARHHGAGDSGRAASGEPVATDAGGRLGRGRVRAKPAAVGAGPRRRSSGPAGDGSGGHCRDAAAGCAARRSAPTRHVRRYDERRSRRVAPGCEERRSRGAAPDAAGRRCSAARGASDAADAVGLTGDAAVHGELHERCTAARERAGSAGGPNRGRRVVCRAGRGEIGAGPTRWHVYRRSGQGRACRHERAPCSRASRHAGRAAAGRDAAAGGGRAAGRRARHPRTTPGAPDRPILATRYAENR
jgi:hypothetical protein